MFKWNQSIILFFLNFDKLDTNHYLYTDNVTVYKMDFKLMVHGF